MTPVWVTPMEMYHRCKRTKEKNLFMDMRESIDEDDYRSDCGIGFQILRWRQATLSSCTYVIVVWKPSRTNSDLENVCWEIYGCATNQTTWDSPYVLIERGTGDGRS